MRTRDNDDEIQAVLAHIRKEHAAHRAREGDQEPSRDDRAMLLARAGGLAQRLREAANGITNEKIASVFEMAARSLETKDPVGIVELARRGLLTTLPYVGPKIAERLHAWLEIPPTTETVRNWEARAEGKAFRYELACVTCGVPFASTQQDRRYCLDHFVCPRTDYFTGKVCSRVFPATHPSMSLCEEHRIVTPKQVAALEARGADTALARAILKADVVIRGAQERNVFAHLIKKPAAPTIGPSGRGSPGGATCRRRRQRRRPPSPVRQCGRLSTCAS
jgi:hypothetical protein